MNAANCFRLASLFGFLSVALGAFGAHALKTHLSAYHLGVFETGVEYQFYHSLALAFAGVLLDRQSPANAWFVRGAWAFSFGMVVFSGSLYLLAGTGQKFWGAITPIGGVSFLFGWVCLFLGIRSS